MRFEIDGRTVDAAEGETILEAADAAGTRFFGLKRECGLHEMDFGKTG